MCERVRGKGNCGKGDCDPCSAPQVPAHQVPALDVRTRFYDVTSIFFIGTYPLVSGIYSLHFDLIFSIGTYPLVSGIYILHFDLICPYDNERTLLLLTVCLVNNAQLLSTCAPLVHVKLAHFASPRTLSGLVNNEQRLSTCAPLVHVDLAQFASPRTLSGFIRTCV